MQRWGYGTNHIYKTCYISLYEAPWWVWWLLDANWWLCDRIPGWTIPFVGRIQIVRDGENYTFAEWYGDDFHSLWHGLIDMPIFDWCQKRFKRTAIPLSWAECRRAFFDSDSERWDEMESDPEYGAAEGMSVEEYTQVCTGHDDCEE